MTNFPSRQNPIVLAPNREQSRRTLSELSQQIESGQLKSQRLNKPDKIPALPFLWDEDIVYHSWCFTCLSFISEALRHFIIKNRHDARFGGLPEKKALCGNCLAKRLDEMPVRKRYLGTEYHKRGYGNLL